MEVADDGVVTSRRVVTIARAGRFASKLDGADLKSLEKAVAAVASAEVEIEAPSRPPYEIEDIETGQASLSFHPEQKLPRPVTTLRNRLRALYEELADHPVAAVELSVAESGKALTVRTIGSEPCQVDWSNAAATYDLYDARQAFETSGSADLELGSGRQEVAPGWEKSATLSEVAFSPEKTLQVRLTFSMKFDEERWRECQLTVVAGKGW